MARLEAGPVARRAGHALLLTMALVVAGCARAKPPEDPHQRVQAFLDAGNEAFRTGDFALAARRYAAAASLDPQEPACYVGLGMALGKLNRSEEARAAYQRARELASQQRDSTASP